LHLDPTNGASVGGSVLAPPTDTTPTLAEVGLTKKQSSKAQKLGDSAMIPVTTYSERAMRELSIRAIIDS
jgi:hypothetical protein